MSVLYIQYDWCFYFVHTPWRLRAPSSRLRFLCKTAAKRDLMCPPCRANEVIVFPNSIPSISICTMSFEAQLKYHRGQNRKHIVQGEKHPPLRERTLDKATASAEWRVLVSACFNSEECCWITSKAKEITEDLLMQWPYSISTDTVASMKFHNLSLRAPQRSPCGQTKALIKKETDFFKGGP